MNIKNIIKTTFIFLLNIIRRIIFGILSILLLISSIIEGIFRAIIHPIIWILTGKTGEYFLDSDYFISNKINNCIFKILPKDKEK